jgi:hypothetical protein
MSARGPRGVPALYIGTAGTRGQTPKLALTGQNAVPAPPGSHTHSQETRGRTQPNRRPRTVPAAHNAVAMGATDRPPAGGAL